VSALLRALVVDDEEPARRLLAEYLASTPGWELAGECANGFEAVKAAAQSRPDVVLLDVQMPKLDGFEVLELLGGDAPAVVFVTAHDEHALRAFEVHAVDYLLKPFSQQRLDTALAHARLGPAPAPALEGVLRLVRSVSPAMMQDRSLARDIEAVHHLVAAGDIGRAIERSGEDAIDARAAATKLLQGAATAKGPLQRLAGAKMLTGAGGDRDDLSRRLLAMSSLVRDLGLLNARADARTLANADLKPQLEALLRNVGYHPLIVESADEMASLRDVVTLCLIDLRESGSETMRSARTFRAQYPQSVVIGVADPARPSAAADASVQWR